MKFFCRFVKLNLINWIDMIRILGLFEDWRVFGDLYKFVVEVIIVVGVVVVEVVVEDEFVFYGERVVCILKKRVLEIYVELIKVFDWRINYILILYYVWKSMCFYWGI